MIAIFLQLNPWMHNLKSYLDHNASSPMLPQAIEAWQRAAVVPGNPSSMHWAGRQARRLLDDARDVIAQHLEVESSAVIFTSGGTEANNLCLAGVLTGNRGKVVISAIEHPSVLNTAKALCAHQQCELVLIAADTQGVIDADKMCAAIDADTVLVSLMLANNETGVIQPVAAVGAHCRQLGVPFHVDAVQGLGKLAVTLEALQADFLTASGHKIGGSKGTGVLVQRRGSRLSGWMHGGGQERKRRSGTENVAGAASFAAALQYCDFSACQNVRDYFESLLITQMPDVVIHGQQASRLGNTSCFSVPGMDGETLLMQLDLAGFAVASGSACSSGKREPSHVLRAMGVDDTLARASLRVSFGPEHDKNDAEALLQSLLHTRKVLQRMAAGSL